MGWEQRSRRKLAQGTTCYLCGEPITDSQQWNRDHLPPARFYGKGVRTKYQPNLRWLPTHNECNSAYREDEELFVVSFAGHVRSETGGSVFEDVRRGAEKGHGLGLLKQVASQFGKVFLPDGSVTFSYDTDRAGRAVWKIVRGLYFNDVGKVLREGQPKRLFLLGPTEARNAHETHPWWTHVRDTGSMGTHGAVFDYKWLGLVFGGGVRGHALAMLVWDGLLVLAVFHDPACRCEQCVSPRSDAANPAAPQPEVLPA